MTKTLSMSILVLALLAPAGYAGAATKEECKRAAKEAVPGCVQACDQNPNPIAKRFKARCKSFCRSKRYKKQFINTCIGQFVPGGDVAAQ